MMILSHQALNLGHYDQVYLRLDVEKIEECENYFISKSTKENMSAMVSNHLGYQQTEMQDWGNTAQA
ncbi:MAG: hypothetical protein V7776_12660 [Halopseudomonas aestusnigri]